MSENRKKTQVQILLEPDLAMAINRDIAQKQYKTGLKGDSFKKTVEDIAIRELKKVFIPSGTT